LGEEPVARVAAGEFPLENFGVPSGKSAVEHSGEGVLADAGFAFDGGYAQVWADELGLFEEFAYGGTCGDELRLVGIEKFARLC
jgi:hypothetical protein